MRALLAVAIVVLLVTSGAGGWQPRAVGMLGAPSVEPGGVDGRTPVDRLVGTAAANPGEGSVDLLELTREAAKHGTLGLLLLAVLWSYRRDFFRKDEDRVREIAEHKADKAELTRVLDHSSVTLKETAVTTARQTDATHRLARAVENMERRQAGLPPGASTPQG